MWSSPAPEAQSWRWWTAIGDGEVQLRDKGMAIELNAGRAQATARRGLDPATGCAGPCGHHPARTGEPVSEKILSARSHRSDKWFRGRGLRPEEHHDGRRSPKAKFVFVASPSRTVICPDAIHVDAGNRRHVNATHAGGKPAIVVVACGRHPCGRFSGVVAAPYQAGRQLRVGAAESPGVGCDRGQRILVVVEHRRIVEGSWPDNHRAGIVTVENP